MISPEDKYQSDPEYAYMVNAMKGMIHRCQFTPSELREMTMLACIQYERERGQPVNFIFHEDGYLDIFTDNKTRRL